MLADEVSARVLTEVDDWFSHNFGSWDRRIQSILLDAKCELVHRLRLMAQETLFQKGIGTVIANDGVILPIDSLAKTFNYNSDNTVNYIQVTYQGVNYRQTYTYSSGLVSTISVWNSQ